MVRFWIPYRARFFRVHPRVRHPLPPYLLNSEGNLAAVDDDGAARLEEAGEGAAASEKHESSRGVEPGLRRDVHSFPLFEEYGGVVWQPVDADRRALQCHHQRAFSVLIDAG